MRDSARSGRASFYGLCRGPLHRELESLRDSGLELAWLRQIHSATVQVARPGLAGTGDALVTTRTNLALVIVTADCVPVLLAAHGRCGAAHAGWRGICDGVVSATLERLGAPARDVTAWVGPTIGACCYEVGEDVAARVCRASAGDVVRARPGSRPHLDLGHAVQLQLQRRGVEDIRRLRRCTRCDTELASYRRDGARAGRNLSVVWLPGRS